MDNLDTIVARYGRTDAQLKEMKKCNDKDKEDIKTILAEMGKDDWTAGGYTVKRVVSTSDNLNEDKVLEVMRKHREVAELNGIIKLKEYIDPDALESAIYSGMLSEDILQEMDSCRETKTTVALRCTKVKEK